MGKPRSGAAGDLRRTRAGDVRRPVWCLRIWRGIKLVPVLPDKPLAATCRTGCRMVHAGLECPIPSPLSEPVPKANHPPRLPAQPPILPPYHRWLGGEAGRVVEPKRRIRDFWNRLSGACDLSGTGAGTFSALMKSGRTLIPSVCAISESPSEPIRLEIALAAWPPPASALKWNIFPGIIHNMDEKSTLLNGVNSSFILYLSASFDS
jgi:hypothetical protein